MGDDAHGVGAGVMDYCEAAVSQEERKSFQRRQGGREEAASLELHKEKR